MSEAFEAGSMTGLRAHCLLRGSRQKPAAAFPMRAGVGVHSVQQPTRHGDVDFFGLALVSAQVNIDNGPNPARVIGIGLVLGDGTRHGKLLALLGQSLGVQVDGLTNGGRTSGDGNGSGGGIGSGNLASDAVSAALAYRAQAPVLDGLMKELGLDGSSLSGLVKGAA